MVVVLSGGSISNLHRMRLRLVSLSVHEYTSHVECQLPQAEFIIAPYYKNY